MLNKIFFLSALLMLNSCMIKDGKYIPDNPVEEIAEQVLKSQTGIDVDFTPSTPEKK